MNNIINELKTLTSITNFKYDEDSLDKQYKIIKKIFKDKEINAKELLKLLNDFPFVINNIHIDYPDFFSTYKNEYLNNFYALIYTKSIFFDFIAFSQKYDDPPKAYLKIFYNKLENTKIKKTFIETYPKFLDIEPIPSFLDEKTIQKIIIKSNNKSLFFKSLHMLNQQFIKKFLFENPTFIPEYYENNSQYDSKLIEIFIENLITKIDLESETMHLFIYNSSYDNKIKFLFSFLLKIKDHPVFIKEIEKNFFLSNIIPDLTSLSTKKTSFNLLLDQLLKLKLENTLNGFQSLNCFNNFSKISLSFLSEIKDDNFFILNTLGKLKQLSPIISDKDFLMIKKILIEENDAKLITEILKENTIYNI